MNININNYEEWMIDYLEGNLSPAQQKELTEFLAFHPELKADLDLFQETKLHPDMDVVFANKESLKKETGGRVITMFSWVKYSVAAAAVVMVFIGVRLFNNNSSAPIAIQRYQYQSDSESFAISRPVDEEEETIKDHPAVIQHNVAPQFAQEHKKKQIERPGIDQREKDKGSRRTEYNITDAVEFAIAKPIHTDENAPQLADNHVTNTNVHSANTNKKDKDYVNISLNDNNSVVDWWNDAMALGGEMEKVATGIINYDIDPFKNRNTSGAVPNEVKTKSVNILGIEYYSRKKTSN